jgi:hypothetical protein
VVHSPALLGTHDRAQKNRATEYASTRGRTNRSVEWWNATGSVLARTRRFGLVELWNGSWCRWSYGSRVSCRSAARSRSRSPHLSSRSEIPRWHIRRFDCRSTRSCRVRQRRFRSDCRRRTTAIFCGRSAGSSIFLLRASSRRTIALEVLRCQGPADIAALARTALSRNYRAAFLRFFRNGEFDFREHVSFLNAVEWPTTVELSICAMESRNGERAVMQRGSNVPLADAVAASCAVPAVMKAIQIGGGSYVDGGLVSPTSADLLAGEAGPKLVVISSPMSGTHSRSVVGRVSSHLASMCLRRELKAFAPDQTVVSIEPTSDLSRLVVDENLRRGAERMIMQRTFTSLSLSTSRI